MADRKKGTVTRIGKSQYSFFVQLDGEGFYYNTKFEPKCGEGDVVGIEFDRKGDTRGNIKKLTVLTDNGGAKGMQESSGGSWDDDKKPATSKRAGGNDRQDSIVYQSSRKDALVLVEILLDAEAFAVKGKADEKRLQIEALVDEITVRFFNDAENPRDSAAFKAAKELKGDSDDESNDEGGDGDWGGGGNDEDEWS